MMIFIKKVLLKTNLESKIVFFEPRKKQAIMKR